METLYQIVFSGKLVPGKSLQDIVPSLSSRFRLREETARGLILGGEGRVLKHNLTASAAAHYREALEEVGLVVLVKPQDPTDSLDVASILHSDLITTASPRAPLPSDQRAAHPHPAATWDGSATRCPKCGANEVSPLTGVCQACGVVVERYLANHGLTPATSQPDWGNQYAPPRADLTPPRLDPGVDTLHDPRAVAAGRGWGWIVEAWLLFKAQPWTWIGLLLLFYLILTVLSLVPMVGGLAVTLLGPLFSAGLMLGAHTQYQGGRCEISHLFAGFTRHSVPLVLVGLVYLGLMFGIGMIVVMLTVSMAVTTDITIEGAMMDPSQMDSLAMGPAFALPVLVGLLLGLPLGMALFFAPSLVALNDVPVLRAFKLSFLGCLRNILPFLVYSLIALVLFVVGVIPLLLGLLVVVPLLTISIYIAYRDIYYHSI